MFSVSEKLFCLIIALVISGCASTPQVVVDPKTIANAEKYDTDLKECQTIAATYDLSSKTAGSAAVGAVAGGAAVAGIATAVAGAVFWPAIPFIAAGTLLGGGTAGGLSKSKETAARENILSECLADKGYKTYKPS